MIPTQRLRGLSATLLALLLATLASPPGVEAQDDNQVRVGITVGGIGLWGIVVEYRWDDIGVEANLATFAFRDASLALTAKRYFGGGDLRPFVGLGLWGVAGKPEEDPQKGLALLAIAPIGADWSFAEDHAFGGSLNVNRGLWIRRSDPADDTPISRRPIPLPGIYYRYQR